MLLRLTELLASCEPEYERRLPPLEKDEAVESLLSYVVPNAQPSARKVQSEIRHLGELLRAVNESRREFEQRT